VLDDFGLVPLSAQAVENLYEIIRERYERRPILLTSNRAPEEWAEVFGNALLASAALGRLTHHAHILTLTGASYRQRKTSRIEQDNPEPADRIRKSRTAAPSAPAGEDKRNPHGPARGYAPAPTQPGGSANNKQERTNGNAQ